MGDNVAAITRKSLLALIPFAGCALAGIETAIGSPIGRKPRPRLFFTSKGKTAVVNADGSGLHYFDFKVRDQVTWQPGPFLSDGKRVVFLSMEQRRDGP